MRLDTLELALKGGRDGKVITPGDSANSKLVHAISQLDPEFVMPPKPRQRRGPGGPNPGNPPQNPPGGPAQPQGQAELEPPPPGTSPRRGPQGPPPKPLTPEQVGLVRAWIDQGAK